MFKKIHEDKIFPFSAFMKAALVLYAINIEIKYTFFESLNWNLSNFSVHAFNLSDSTISQTIWSTIRCSLGTDNCSIPFIF